MLSAQLSMKFSFIIFQHVLTKIFGYILQGLENVAVENDTGSVFLSFSRFRFSVQNFLSHVLDVNSCQVNRFMRLVGCINYI